MFERSKVKNHLLAAALAQAGKSNEKIAAETGVHKVTISRLLNLRQRPTDETAQKIADALNTSPCLLGWETTEGGAS